MHSGSDESGTLERRRSTKSTPTKTSHYFLSQGSKVEACSEDEGFQNAWFPATVVEPPKPAVNPPPGRRTKRRKTAVVRYDHMLDDSTGEPLVEALRVALIRPSPPPPDGAEALERNDVVDAFHDDIWWTGFVVRVEGDRYTVAFKNPPDVLEVGRSELRAHMDWVGSEWVKPPKEVPSSSLFCLTSEVEIDFDKDKPGTTWLPAVSLGRVRDDHFMIKYKVSGNDGVESEEKLVVHVKQIRPRPAPIEKKNFDLLEKVEALCGSCWSVGSITRCLEGYRYTVTFKHEKKEKDFSHRDLRPHLDWIDFKWVTDLKGVQIISGCQEHLNPAISNVGNIQIIEVDESSDSQNESLCSSTLEAAQKGTTDFSVKNTQDPGKTENNASISAEKRDLSPQSQFRISWCGTHKRKILSKSNPRNLQSSNTGINAMDAGLSESAGKESLEPNGSASKEFETPGMAGRPKEVRDSHVEQSFQSLIRKCETTGMSCTINGKGKNPEARASNLQTTEATGNHNSSEAVVTVGDVATEKSESPPATPTKSIDEQALVSLISRNGSSGDQALIMPVEEANSLTNIGNHNSSEAVVTAGHVATEKSKSPATPTKSIDEQAVVPHISRNGSSGDQALIMLVEETNSLTNIGDIEPKLPFVKNSPVWQFLESTQVFRNSPQNPHFRPLLNHRENVREGVAIGYMVNFSAMIGDIYKLQENNSRDYVDEILERLAEFEELGFDVKVFKNRLKGMQAMRDEREKLQDELKGVRSKIEECADEIIKADEKVAEIDKELEKFKRKRAELMFGSSEKQSKMVKLISEAVVMDVSYSCACDGLRSLIIDPW